MTWVVEPLVDAVQSLVVRTPAVVGIDGRSSSGKTTLARRITELMPEVAVVHTDDVAWHHSIFGWVDLLLSGVVEPFRRGEPVVYRPPAWDERGRAGAIEVPPGRSVLLVEGVGAGRRELAEVFDATVWVESDPAETERRNAARIAAGEVTQAIHDGWMAEEEPFLAEQRPWEHASLVVAGVPVVPHDPVVEVVVAR